MSQCVTQACFATLLQIGIYSFSPYVTETETHRHDANMRPKAKGELYNGDGEILQQQCRIQLIL